MQFERRSEISLSALVLAPVFAIIIALILCGGLIAAAGVNPLTAYASMFKGALGSRLSITETLTRAVPLIFTGLAAAVAFRARVWNIGCEGQFYIGALVTAGLGHNVFSDISPMFAMPIIITISALAGGLLLMLPVGLRLRFGVDEVVVTLLLNFIVLLFVGLMVEGPLKDPMAFGWPQSVPVAPDLRLPRLIPRTTLHIGFIFVLVAAMLVWLVQSRTVFGAETRAVGLAPRAAAFAGVPIGSRLIAVALLSGGLAALAGSIEVLGPKGYVTTTMSPGFGYAGIVVAMLAGLHPVGVVGAALFIATVFVGADAMSRSTGVPSFIADVIMATTLLAMLTALLFTSYRIRR